LTGVLDLAHYGTILNVTGNVNAPPTAHVPQRPARPRHPAYARGRPPPRRRKAPPSRGGRGQFQL